MAMLIERVEQRVLGAICLMDSATGTPITRPMQVKSDNARLTRNSRGFYVITQAEGLETHEGEFVAPPSTPTVGANSYTFDIRDPQNRYLPRTLDVSLPRDPDPENRANANSLFHPQEAILYPSSIARLSHNWSTVRVSVTEHSLGVPGCLIQILDDADDTILANGFSDERGEALVIVPGVSVTQFSDDDDGNGGGPGHGGGPGGGGGSDPAPVTVNTLAVRLEVSHAAGTIWPINPETLISQHAANLQVSRNLTLSTGKMESLTINLS